MAIRTVRDLPLRRKRVLLRADLNVPLRDGAVADDTRIRAALPTIEYLLEGEASIVVCSHLGRPGGEVQAALRLRPVAERLAALTGVAVTSAPGCTGAAVTDLANLLAPGQIMLLENLRFDPGEERNAPEFAAALAGLAEAYVNDAFGAAHRAHASTVGVAELLPSAAGLLLSREVEVLSGVFAEGAGRTAVVSGGAKVSGKLGLLHSIVEHAQVLCLGGAMANTFLLAQGMDVADSLAEPGMVDEARTILASAAAHHCELLLPVDGVVAAGPEQPPRARPVSFVEEPVPAGQQLLDVGPRTIELFAAALAEADTVVWNGPLGLFERAPFAGGTQAMAGIIAGLKARTIVCGGETAQAIQEAGVAASIDHISTGGAAALELLEGRTLPGIAALPQV